mgnify:CR=1 FL=1
MTSEYIYSPYKPDPHEVIDNLKKACELAEAGESRKFRIFSAWKINTITNEMYPLALTINCGDKRGEVVYAQNLLAALQKCNLDPRSRKRLPAVIEFLGDIG